MVVNKNFDQSQCQHFGEWLMIAAQSMVTRDLHNHNALWLSPSLRNAAMLKSWYPENIAWPISGPFSLIQYFKRRQSWLNICSAPLEPSYEFSCQNRALVAKKPYCYSVKSGVFKNWTLAHRRHTNEALRSFAPWYKRVGLYRGVQKSHVDLRSSDGVLLLYDYNSIYCTTTKQS